MTRTTPLILQTSASIHPLFEKGNRFFRGILDELALKITSVKLILPQERLENHFSLAHIPDGRQRKPIIPLYLEKGGNSLFVEDRTVEIGVNFQRKDHDPSNPDGNGMISPGFASDGDAGTFFLCPVFSLNGLAGKVLSLERRRLHAEKVGKA